MHWAAGLGGAAAPGPAMGVPAFGHAVPGMPPVAPLAAPPIRAPPRPWASVDGAELLDHLFARVTPASAVAMPQWDALANALVPAGTALPAWAVQPADDIAARWQYVVSRLEHLTQGGPLPPVNADGWSGVFAAVRSLLRTFSQPDLSSSFGRSAMLHQHAAGLGGGSSSDPMVGIFGASLPSAASGDPVAAQAVQRAATAVDREQPPFALRSAAIAANSMGVPIDIDSVSDLGARLSALPQELQVLNAADNVGFSPSSSASMAEIAPALSSASKSFFGQAAEQLRVLVGCERAVPVDEARADARASVIKRIMRGKPLSVTRPMINGSTEAVSLFDLLESGKLQEFKEMCDWEDAIVRMCGLVPRGASSIFVEMKSAGPRMINVDSHAAAVVAAWFKERVSALERAFKRFYTFQSLTRPTYDQSAVFGTAEATASLQEVTRSHLNASVQAIASRAIDGRLAELHAASSIAAAQPVAGYAGYVATAQPVAAGYVPMSALPSPQVMAAYQAAAQASTQPPPLPQPVPVHPHAAVPSKRAAKRAKEAAKKAAATAAAAAAPAVVAAAAAAAPQPAQSAQPAQPPAPPQPPPAPPTVPAVNTVGVIGGPPQVGPAAYDVMRAFSDANPSPSEPGKGRCFNFWRRGVCRRGTQCPFAHT